MSDKTHIAVYINKNFLIVILVAFSIYSQIAYYGAHVQFESSELRYKALMTFIEMRKQGYSKNEIIMNYKGDIENIQTILDDAFSFNMEN